jgi:hypothetical protein
MYVTTYAKNILSRCLPSKHNAEYTGIQFHSNVPDIKALLDSRHRPIVSGKLYQVLSTKLELYVSEGFRLISQFTNRHVRNFAFRELREYALSVKGVRGNKNGKKFWCGLKCRADEVYVHVSSMECRTKS